MPAKIISPYNFTFDRGNPEPIDKNSVFSSLTALNNYLNSKVVYAGQFVGVYDSTDTSHNGPYYIDYVNNSYIAIPVNAQANSVWMTIADYHELEINGTVDENIEYNLYEPDLKIYSYKNNTETLLTDVYTFYVVTPDNKHAYMKIIFANPTFTINGDLYLYTDNVSIKINQTLINFYDWDSKDHSNLQEWTYKDNMIYINYPNTEKLGIKIII